MILPHAALFLLGAGAAASAADLSPQESKVPIGPSISSEIPFGDGMLVKSTAENDATATTVVSVASSSSSLRELSVTNIGKQCYTGSQECGLCDLNEAGCSVSYDEFSYSQILTCPDKCGPGVHMFVGCYLSCDYGVCLANIQLQVGDCKGGFPISDENYCVPVGCEDQLEGIIDTTGTTAGVGSVDSVGTDTAFGSTAAGSVENSGGLPSLGMLENGGDPVTIPSSGNRDGLWPSAAVWMASVALLVVS